MGLYREISGDGPTVLLIHGVISDHSYFDALVPYLEPLYRTIRYDRRGYGLDCVYDNGDDFSLETQIKDAATILEFEPKPAIIIAHSAGSLIALGLAKRYPTFVRGLILIEPFLGCDKTDQPMLEDFHQRIIDLAAKGKLLPALTVISQAGGESRPKKAADRGSDSIARMKQNLCHFMYREIHAIFDHREDLDSLKKLQVPVRVGISGSPDSLYASVSWHDAALIGWPTFPLPAGHNCLQSDSDTCQETLIRELNKVAIAAPV